MLRALAILCGFAALAWSVGLHGVAAHMAGLIVLVTVATLVGSALGGYRDDASRELYRRDLRRGPDD